MARHSRDESMPAWEIAVPSLPGGLPGVTMAGFRDRSMDAVDLRFVPHPAVTLIFDLGDTPIAVDDGAGSRQSGSVVTGLAPRGAGGRARDFACLQVRLSPLVAHAVLGPSPEMGGSVMALADVWGREAARIEERLRSARSWDERFAIASSAIAHRATLREVDAEVAHVWRHVIAGRGRVRIERLASEVGWSRKRLWSRFRTQIGLTPKRAAELVRFDHAAHSLASGRSVAAVAAECGYADQSHLSREVQAFAGTTPTGIAGEPWLSVDRVAWAR